MNGKGKRQTAGRRILEKEDDQIKGHLGCVLFMFWQFFLLCFGNLLATNRTCLYSRQVFLVCCCVFHTQQMLPNTSWPTFFCHG